MALLGGLSAFDSARRLFASVSADQRLKIFDIAANKLTFTLQEKNHLNTLYTSISIFTSSAHPTSAPSKKSSKSPPSTSSSQSYVALGSKTGSITVWNLATGDILYRLGSIQQADAHTSIVHDLVFDSKGTNLFSTSEDGTIKAWSMTNGALTFTIKTGEKGGFKKLALSHDDALLCAAGNFLKVYSVNTQTITAQFTGHADTIQTLCFSPDSRFIFSGSGDRFISAWDLLPVESNSKDKKKKTNAQPRNTAVHTFTMSTPPIAIAASQFHVPSSSSSEGVPSADAYHIMALSESSVLNLWKYRVSSSSSTSSSSSSASSAPQGTISIPSAHTTSEASRKRFATIAQENAAASKVHGNKTQHKKVHNTMNSSTVVASERGDELSGNIHNIIFSCAFLNQNSIIVARGDSNVPRFQSIVYTDEKNGEILSNIQLDKLSTHGTLIDDKDENKKRKNSTVNNEVTALGPANLTHVASVTDENNLDDEQARKKTKLAHAKAKSDALNRSLADRLAEHEAFTAAAAERGASFSSSSSSSSSSTSSASGTTATSSALSTLSGNAIPTSGSLSTVLSQALHSKDEALLEYCLSWSSGGTRHSLNNLDSDRLIRNTIKRLSPHYILPLLQALLARFQSRPNRSFILIPWIRSIFSIHTVYLLHNAPPTFLSTLQPLYHLIDSRVAIFKKLLKLQGRLDLLLTHLSYASNEQDDAVEQHHTTTTYNEGEEEAMELAKQKRKARGEEDDDEEEGDDDDEDDDEDMDGEDEDDEDDDGEDGEALLNGFKDDYQDSEEEDGEEEEDDDDDEE